MLFLILQRSKLRIIISGLLFCFFSCFSRPFLCRAIPNKDGESSGASPPTQKILFLSSEKEQYSLGEYLYILEDRQGDLQLADVRALDDSFVRYTQDEPNIGFSGSVFWVRIGVHNGSPHREWILEYSYPPFDRIELHKILENGQSMPVRKSGEMVPYNERPIPHRYYLFNLDPPPGETTLYYLRFQSESSVSFPLKIWSRGAFTSKDLFHQFVQGLYFGLLLVMILYNFLIYMSSRELSYLYYILFVISNLFFQLSMTGLGAVYLWPMHPWWSNRSLNIFASLTIAFGILFTRGFLRMKQLQPHIYKLLNFFLLAAFLNFALSLFIPYAVSIMANNNLLLVLAIIFIVTGIRSYRMGYLPARFYLIAWFTLLAAALIVAVKNFGIIPSNDFTNSILQIGSALEVILLSLALADRIKHLMREKEKAEQANLESQQKTLEITKERLYTDPMTGLPNRNGLIKDIESLVNPNLFLINADRFKEINDFYGYETGNAIIVELGKRICACEFPRPFKVYKLHADEFAITIDSDLNQNDFNGLGRLLHYVCQNESYYHNNQIIPLEVSIGIASSRDNLLEKADMALTQARNSHKIYCVYDPSKKIVKQYENNLKWANIIRKSLEHGRVFPFFQPIKDNYTGKIEKYESLLRLQIEDGSIIAPASFLSIAKKSKLYAELSKVIIRKSFSVFNNTDKEFSINISVDDILDSNTVSLIEHSLDRYDVSNRVVFEILESEGIQSYESVSNFIHEMKARGCKIAIDDFGTGYSNFYHILRLSVDYLKIDASLIENIQQDLNSQYIVETIIDFSKKLELKTIAEFVHSREIFEKVKQMGIDYSQGYFIGKPEPFIQPD